MIPFLNLNLNLNLTGVPMEPDLLAKAISLTMIWASNQHSGSLSPQDVCAAFSEFMAAVIQGEKEVAAAKPAAS